MFGFRSPLARYSPNWSFHFVVIIRKYRFTDINATLFIRKNKVFLAPNEISLFWGTQNLSKCSELIQVITASVTSLIFKRRWCFKHQIYGTCCSSVDVDDRPGRSLVQLFFLYLLWIVYTTCKYFCDMVWLPTASSNILNITAIEIFLCLTASDITKIVKFTFLFTIECRYRHKCKFNTQVFRFIRIEKATYFKYKSSPYLFITVVDISSNKLSL